MINSLPQMQIVGPEHLLQVVTSLQVGLVQEMFKVNRLKVDGLVGREETLIHKIWEMIVMLANGVGDKLIEAGPIWLWSAGRRFPINPDTPWSLMGSQRVPGVLVMIVSIDPTDLMRKLMLGRRLGQTGSLIIERMRITYENLFPRRYFFLGNVFYLLESHCGRVDLPPLPLVHAWVLRIRSCWLGLWNFHNHYLFLILMIKTAQKGCSTNLLMIANPYNPTTHLLILWTGNCTKGWQCHCPVLHLDKLLQTVPHSHLDYSSWNHAHNS